MSLTLLFAIALAAGPLQAQETTPAPKSTQTSPVDSGWAPWLGCWQPAEEGLVAGWRVCVTPNEASGVTLRTLVGDQPTSEESIIADGASHPIRDAECQGSERAEWSRNGQRVFRRADVTCGKGAPRRLSGLAFLTPELVKSPRAPLRHPFASDLAFLQTEDLVWIDVQFVESAGTESVRVRRYRRAVDQSLPGGATLPPSSALAAATAPADTPWTVSDVIEASAKLPPDAVQAALSELNMGFALNAKGLIAMDDAGVADSVIDLMIALTYPSRFVVDRAGGSPDSIVAIGPSTGPVQPFYGYSGYLPYFGYGYSGYDPYFGYGYSGYYPYFGYGYSGYYPGGGYGGGYYPGYPGGGGGTRPQPEGRVVNGRGYTQVRPREAGSGGYGSTGSTAGANGSSSGSSSGSSGGASSGGVSTQGYSGGGAVSGGGGGRTAVIR